MSTKSERKRAVRALTSLGAALCVELLQRERDRNREAIMWYLGGLIVIADKLRELGAHNFITEIRTDDVKLAFAARGLFVPDRKNVVIADRIPDAAAAKRLGRETAFVLC